DYARRETLHGQRVVSDAAVDETQARFLALQAQLRQGERESEVARLPARTDARDAARAAVSAAAASVDRAEARTRRLTGVAPVEARVENTFYEAGETPVAGQPLVAL